ncbi:acid ceramidase-like [Brachionus plicatilis]|uniref:Acid ceramidase n=1 Tax=Brachionus plicatilis TaxID=10195 RepID=A0A3M7Q3W7_BRAPC|nr:acid ceramidase-like [Brachionus plicatilis]
MKLLICLLFLSVTLLVRTEPEQVCENGKYPPDPSTSFVPTYVVNLDLPPSQRWQELSRKYQKPLSAIVTYIKKFVLEFSPKLQKLIDLIDNKLGLVADSLPEPYGEEIKGIANATNIELGELVLYNIFYEVFTLCTSIVGEDSNGKMYHARNLDFGLFLGWDLKNDTWIISELLRPLIMNINYTKGGELKYKTVTFFGFVGLITGVKPNAFSVSVNERFNANGGYIGLFEWFLNINRKQAWTTLVARDCFENDDMDFNHVVKTLANTPLIAPVYYIIAGPVKQQGAIVTRDRAKAVDVWLLGSNNTWFIAETNYDHWKNPLIIDDRITPCNRCMNKLGKEKMSFEGLFNVLSSKPVLNKLTVYSALIEPKTGRLETYIQYCPTPCDPF